MRNKLYILFSFILSLSVLTSQAENRDQSTGLQNNLKYELKILQDTIEGYFVKTKSSTRLFNDMDNSSSVILMIPADTIVEVFEMINDYYSASYTGNKGYIFTSKVEPLNFQTDSGSGSEDIGQDTKTIDRLTYLVEKYGQEEGELIHARKIWKGMTKKMVLDSWGRPRKIDRHIGSTHVKEEWYYRTKVLFIMDGQLDGWDSIN